ncbi:MAG: AAA family ATPase [Desulfobacteraceae bacterium]|jgi:putative ATPase|nr:replication-associated recombination protein A [Desulfobacteraceae bacterium]MDH3720560.1 replication-associated recombination protein A [Desulfobacteraceae bacterium]MDH3836680.1 replication-associated recombination protein A [Desulfobacteraceae bacterium]MDH3872976.1 replication-associated recombination protein A [Desulfobacteraceae bacterium]PLX53349.1 MAG: AAA family ATPase [Desulfobacteraceae bacterium]
MDLFEYRAQKDGHVSRPLADRIRPMNLDEFIGQRHAVGEGTLIRHAILNDRIFSMILWGPPGCGKTTLARIFASHTRRHFVHFSAVLSGVKEIRSVIEDAKNQQKLFRKKTVLFVDEIHRFNKAQQDAFLHHVESGLITLIGATTENPSFEVIPPLLSRCRVITLNSLSDEDIVAIMRNALKDRERGLGDMNLIFDKDALSHLVRMSDGDARTALNSLETSASLIAMHRGDPSKEKPITITLQDVERAMERKALLYDKTGDEHYNLISAFHKSLRGSDPDAAAYWLGRMLSAGEDPLYVARRMVRFASEDIGNADPHALGVALSAMEAFRFLGQPEGELALVQAAVYLATAPKSNSIYTAYGAVKAVIDKYGALPAPLHIRNAPTALMRGIGYGKDYKYAHDYKDAYTPQDYLPEKLDGRYFYKPTDRGYENRIKQWLEKWRSLKQKEKNAKNGQK